MRFPLDNRQLFTLALAFVITVSLAIAATGCGDGTGPYDNEDRLGEATVAWCEKLYHCGLSEEEEIDLCVDHIMFHFCELSGFCSGTPTETQITETQTCIEDIEGYDCFAVYWGVLPESCSEVYQ